MVDNVVELKNITSQILLELEKKGKINWEQTKENYDSAQNALTEFVQFLNNSTSNNFSFDYSSF